MKKIEEDEGEIDNQPSKDNANLELRLLKNLTEGNEKDRIKYKAGMDVFDIIKHHQK